MIRCLICLSNISRRLPNDFNIGKADLSPSLLSYHFLHYLPLIHLSFPLYPYTVLSVSTVRSCSTDDSERWFSCASDADFEMCRDWCEWRSSSSIRLMKRRTRRRLWKNHKESRRSSRSSAPSGRVGLRWGRFFLSYRARNDDVSTPRWEDLSECRLDHSDRRN